VVIAESTRKLVGNLFRSLSLSVSIDPPTPRKSAIVHWTGAKFKGPSMSAKFEGKPALLFGILGAHCRSVTWPRQSGISGPRRTAPAQYSNHARSIGEGAATMVRWVTA
jgi:hypothetical protein